MYFAFIHKIYVSNNIYSPWRCVSERFFWYQYFVWTKHWECQPLLSKLPSCYYKQSYGCLCYLAFLGGSEISWSSWSWASPYRIVSLSQGSSCGGDTEIPFKIFSPLLCFLGTTTNEVITVLVLTMPVVYYKQWRTWICQDLLLFLKSLFYAGVRVNQIICALITKRNNLRCLQT